MKPADIVVTGAAGQIGYALLFRIIAGGLLGRTCPIHLRLLEVPQARDALDGVVMELQDCASPRLVNITATSDPEVAFENAEYVFLVGAKPRGAGMQRSDLLQANAEIFKSQGEALDRAAARNVRVVVVGNPANTNALIAQRHAPSLDPRCFSAMTRLDQNRARARLAIKLECEVSRLRRLCIWGNHSSTQYPDVSNVMLDGAPVRVDAAWLDKEFIPKVAERGAEIIQARGASSAASAAHAALEHMRDWINGSADWVSMGLYSKGDYDIPEGLVYSFPVQCDGSSTEVVQGLELSPEARERLALSRRELEEELAAIRHLLP